MQALADIHLVILLAEFPTILKFTQYIWEKYSFGTIVEDVDIQGSSVWIWNMEENALNAFASVPLLPERKRLESDTNYRTRVDLMNNFNMLQTDLVKSLALAKHQRSTVPYHVHRNVSTSTWYRWRMGGGFLPKKGTDTDTTATEERSRREYQRNDEIWMMGVAFTTVVAMVGFGLVG
jgi:poly(A) polymerase Pap1